MNIAVCHILKWWHKKKGDLGSYGEALATIHLKRKGHKILMTNFRKTSGEIDIISRDGNNLVFTEVKTRSPSTRVDPMLAVHKKKQDRLIKVANSFTKESRLSRLQTRFDIVSVISDFKNDSLKHYQNAFPNYLKAKTRK